MGLWIDGLEVKGLGWRARMLGGSSVFSYVWGGGCVRHMIVEQVARSKGVPLKIAGHS